MQVKARLNNLRIAPRKVRLTADLIRGFEFFQAVEQLDASVKGANRYMKKLMMSALSNAENNFGIDRNNLKVSKIVVNEGPTLKRWRPRAFGRAAAILKRTSKIELVLEEIEEGKNRKTKEQLEKEKKEKEKEKKREEKRREREDNTEEKTQDKNLNKKNKESELLKSESRVGDKNKGNWASKIFRRKSM